MKLSGKRLILLALPIALVTMGVVRRGQERDAWKSAEAFADGWQAAAEAERGTRSVLHGAAVEGDAWPFYESALDHVDSTFEESEALSKHLFSEDPQADPATRAYLASLDVALDDLRAGAHRSIGGMTIQWEKGCGAQVPRLRSTRILLIALGERAKAEVEAGRPELAVRLWLDGLQFGRDLCQSPILIARCIGFHVTSTVLEQIEESLGALPDESLHVIANALAQLDPLRYTPNNSLSSEAALFVRTSSEIGSGEGLAEFHGMWRYGWSYPLALEEFCEEIDAADRQLQSHEPQQLGELLATCRDLDTEFQAHDNPLIKVWVTHLESVTLSQSRAQAHVRLARMAIAHRLEQELKLEDPWGDGFQVVSSDGSWAAETVRDGQELRFELR